MLASHLTKYSSLLKHKFQFDWGVLYCFEKFCVSEVHEGENIREEEIKELIAALQEEYKDSTFHYINNRIKKFSVNPLHYNLFAVLEGQILSTRAVLYDKGQRITANYERAFYPLNVLFFPSLEEALVDIL